MEEIVFACDQSELSCIIGNLFTEIRPPCDAPRNDHLTIAGITHSGADARLVILGDRCLYNGPVSDLEAARSGPCLERRCEHG